MRQVLAAAVDVPDLDLAVKASRQEQMAPLWEEPDRVDALHKADAVSVDSRHAARVADNIK